MLAILPYYLSLLCFNLGATIVWIIVIYHKGSCWSHFFLHILTTMSQTRNVTAFSDVQNTARTAETNTGRERLIRTRLIRSST